MNWRPWCYTDEFVEQKESNYEIKLFSKRTIKDATCKKYIWSTLNNASSEKNWVSIVNDSHNTFLENNYSFKVGWASRTHAAMQ